MGSADAAWLHMDRPQNLMVINAVMWFDEQVDWTRFREVLQERLVAPFPDGEQKLFGRGWASGRRSGRTTPRSTSTCTCTTSRCRRPATGRRSRPSSPTG